MTKNQFVIGIIYYLNVACEVAASARFCSARFLVYSLCTSIALRVNHESIKNGIKRIHRISSGGGPSVIRSISITFRLPYECDNPPIQP